MIIKNPTAGNVLGLRQLWKEAFGDPDTFLDAFFGTAYDPQRCRCMVEGDTVVAALYWLPCEYMEKKVAYIYAVATAVEFRGKGLCHTLMADAHRVLREQGYEGVILSPQCEKLETLYSAMGYRCCCQLREFVCGPQISDLQFNRADLDSYTRLRRSFLPEGSVVQEGVNLDFLATQAKLYVGNGFLLAARVEGDTLIGLELLGDVSVAPALVAALGCGEGRFRTPGCGNNIAMFRPLGGSALPAPGYFGLIFD